MAGDRRTRFEPPGELGRYLGVFQRPAAQGERLSGAEGFMGAYDTAADEGMLRSIQRRGEGAKLFSAGWSNPLDWHLWTDDGSGYVELHGGLQPTFDDSRPGRGDEITSSEILYLVAGIGGVT